MSDRGKKIVKRSGKRRKAPLPKEGKSQTKKKGSKRNSKPSRFKTLLVLTIIVVVLGSTFTYFIVDSKITRALAHLPSGTGGVLSDSLDLLSGAPIASQILKGELNRRAYHERETQPEGPGEYKISNDLLTIWPRDINFGSDRTRSKPTNINLISGEIKDLSGTNLPKITLEPVKIADLNNTDIRAKKFVPLRSMPKSIKDAVIAIEDERFYSHAGFDLYGIARATAKNIVALGFVEGGSTLTQQLAKNLFLSPKRTLTRKFLELFSAISIERNLSKDQILELYLNEVYLGQDGPVAIHGVGEAANYFFNTPLKDLSVAQSALLAGIIKAPSSYAPRKHPNRAIPRRDLVIEKMKELGYIDENTAKLAKQEPLKLASKPEIRSNSPHLLWSLKNHLAKEYSIDLKATSGLTIKTGIDPYIQSCGESSAESGVRSLEREFPKLRRQKGGVEVGLVAIEPHSGKIRAWIGGRDYRKNQFDHVFQAKRPVGSTIKPFVYLAALDKRLNSYKTATAQSILPDEPISISQRGSSDWKPENYDHKYRGDVTLRYALENSLNIPTVYLAQKVGFGTIMNLFKSLDLFTDRNTTPSMVLGAFDSSLIDLVGAYSAIANGGIVIKPRIFTSVIQHNDEIIASTELSEKRITDEGPAFVLTNILQGVVERGTAARIRSRGFMFEAAGKTGTTDDARDAWFVGFTPDLVTGVWLGFDDNSRIGITGGVAAAPIWGDFMKCVSKLHPPSRFIVPPDVIRMKIDTQSGEKATADCPGDDIVDEYYVIGTEPTRSCSLHGTRGSRIDPHAEHQYDNNQRSGKPRKKELPWWKKMLGW